MAGITSKGNQYLNIIETYREGKKVKQKVVANLGRVDELKISSIEKLAQKLLDIVDSPKSVDDSSTPNIEELERYNYGFVIYRNIWNRLGLDTILDSLVEDRNISYDFKSVVFTMVVDRLLKPKSKLALFDN